MSGESGSGGGGGTFGLSHLSGMPITLTYGMLLIIVLIALIALRLVFGSITVSGGAR